MTGYVPGVCNIGPAEIARRRRSGWLAAVVAVVAWGVLVGIDAPRELRLLLFVPAAGSAIGFLQAATHFCAYFGLAAQFNLSASVGATETVVEAEFRARDRRKARQIVLAAAGIGGVIALLAYRL